MIWPIRERGSKTCATSEGKGSDWHDSLRYRRPRLDDSRQQGRREHREPIPSEVFEARFSAQRSASRPIPPPRFRTRPRRPDGLARAKGVATERSRPGRRLARVRRSSRTRRTARCGRPGTHAPRRMSRKFRIILRNGNYKIGMLSGKQDITGRGGIPPPPASVGSFRKSGPAAPSAAVAYLYSTLTS